VVIRALMGSNWNECQNYRIEKFAHARRAEDENGGDAVLDADLGVALIGPCGPRAPARQSTILVALAIYTAS